MAQWLKLVYNSEERSAASDWKRMTWISDHHRRARDGRVTHRPRYAVGDEILIYDVTHRVCPARVRVQREPEFDPRRVSREGRRGDGKRWGWLTEVKLEGAVDLDGAPTLLELGIDPMSTRQRDHLRLRDPEPHRRAKRLIPDGLGRGKPKRSRPVPIEEAHTESFFQRFERATKTATRTEQRLVRRYAEYLQKRGRHVERHLLRTGDSAPLYTDLFETERRNLVEAKARVTRPAIRMAIGQLADYERLMDPKPRRRAVLLPERPAEDLEALLRSQSIHAVWSSGRKFVDNANGALT